MTAHGLHVVPFDERHVAPAAQLFTLRYSMLRAGAPLLPAQFIDAGVMEPMLDRLRMGNAGAVAFADGEFAGYLLGHSSIPGFFGSGPGVFVPIWGHGAAPDDRAADVYLALYTELSAQWVERGCYSQAISYFVDGRSQPLEELLFNTGFGLQVMDGLRSMEPIGGAVAVGIDIRPATEHDLAAVQELDGKLGRHLRAAPVFLNTQPVPAGDLLREFLGDGTCTLLAWQDGVAVGGVRGVLNRGDGCDLLNVEGTLGVNFGYTQPAARRSGIATALLDALLAWGREQGMVRCSVDFEAANTSARRFWLTHFQPVCRSAVRKVDDRM